MALARGMSRHQSRFGLAAFNVLTLLLGFFVLRLILWLHFRPDSPVSGLEIAKAFFVGLHLDLFVALLLTFPLVLWLSVIPNRWFGLRWHRWLLRGALLLFWMVQIFLLAA